MSSENVFRSLKGIISKEEKIIKEMNSLINSKEEKTMASSQIDSLKDLLKKENSNFSKALDKISLSIPLKNKIESKEEPEEEIKDKRFLDKLGLNKYSNKELSLERFEKYTLERIKKPEKVEEKKKVKSPSFSVILASRMFSNLSSYLIERKMFKNLSDNLVKANMEFLSKSYVSVIFFSTLVSFIIAIFATIFFLFFNIGVGLPFVTLANENLGIRFLKTGWMLLVFPIVTFLFAYMYPTLEKGVTEKKINNELPFATINLAAISGSMLDPTKIFGIIVSTKEYPYLEKEFIKIINGVNILGNDLITTLRNSAKTSPSKKLSDLFNGIASIINTGGDLPKFFDERAKSLLFEYNLEKEKSTRAAETFMDVYISVVIAAPMILMLLLVIMQISGLGFSLSTGMITLIMVLGVSITNIIFLSFLYIKQSNEG